MTGKGLLFVPALPPYGVILRISYSGSVPQGRDPEQVHIGMTGKGLLFVPALPPYGVILRFSYSGSVLKSEIPNKYISG